jgi:hypothetical protein
MTVKKPKAPVIAEKKVPEITKKRGGARPNSGGKRPGAGRPPGVPNKVTASVREAAQVHSDEAVNTLAAIMQDGKAPAVARIAASNAILDRAHGRPTQSVELEVSTPFTQAEKDGLEADMREGYESLKASGFWSKQKAEMRKRKRLLNEDTP